MILVSRLNSNQPVLPIDLFTHCSTAPLLGADLPEIIPDEYIVVFEPIDHVSREQGIVYVVAKPHVMTRGLKV